jgi:hypothetical protein
MFEARKRAYYIINSTVSEQKRNYAMLATIIDHIRDLAYNEKTVSLWTGLWTNNLLTSIKLKYRNLRQTKLKFNDILKLSRIYTTNAKYIYGVRGKLLLKVENIDTSIPNARECQTLITQFFTAADPSSKKKLVPQSKVSTSPLDKLGGETDRYHAKRGCPVVPTMANKRTTIEPITSQVVLQIDDSLYVPPLPHHNLYRKKSTSVKTGNRTQQSESLKKRRTRGHSTKTRGASEDQNKVHKQNNSCSGGPQDNLVPANPCRKRGRDEYCKGEVSPTQERQMQIPDDDDSATSAAESKQSTAIKDQPVLKWPRVGVG